MPVTTKSKTPKKLTTKKKGDAFEREVALLFRCMPNTKVDTHVKIAGKDVDIYLEVETPFSAPRKIAVDTKDYATPLTRKAATDEYSSYIPLLNNGAVDQIMLITRNGLVANAKEIFDKKDTTHMTIEELQIQIANPTYLLAEMIDQFSSKHLDKYYIKPACSSVDINKAAQNYDLWYNEFITFCLSHHTFEFEVAQKKMAGARQKAWTFDTQIHNNSF